MDQKRVLRWWSRVISPSIPMAFALVLAVVSFANFGTHPKESIWLILGIICLAIIVGGIVAILLLRRQALKKNGTWP